MLLLADEGGGAVWQMLTLADRGGGGVWQMLTLADIGERGVLQMMSAQIIFFKRQKHIFFKNLYQNVGIVYKLLHFLLFFGLSGKRG